MPPACRASSSRKARKTIAPSWLASRGQPTWSLRSNEGVQALRVRIGRGTVTAFNASPFGNDLFTAGDHARLFVTLTPDDNLLSLPACSGKSGLFPGAGFGE